MITEAEGKRIKEIKALVLDGRADLVSPHDRQWVLDLLSREDLPVNATVVARAKAEGLNVEGVKTL